MKLIKSLSNKKFWQKLIVKTVSLPGYVLVFVGWGFFLGLLFIGVYSLLFGSVGPAEVKEAEQVYRIGQAGWVELVLMIAVLLIAWSGMAYFTGKIMRWGLKRFKVSDKYYPVLKLGLLSAGWLLLVLAMAFVFPEVDYLALISGGVLIAAGSLAFALEAALLKFWRLSVRDSW